MRVLLRHVRTGHYYNGNDTWATTQGDATGFEHLEQALQVVIQDKLDGMSLVVIYDESGREQVFELNYDGPGVVLEGG